MEAMSVVTNFVVDISMPVYHTCVTFTTPVHILNTGMNALFVGSDTMFCPLNYFYNSHYNFMVPIFENVAILLFFCPSCFFRPIALFLQSAEDVCRGSNLIAVA